MLFNRRAEAEVGLPDFETRQRASPEWWERHIHLEKLNRFGREERRTRSQIIELALERFLKERGGQEDEIVTSAARFAGRFSREETYAR